MNYKFILRSFEELHCIVSDYFLIMRDFHNQSDFIHSSVDFLSEAHEFKHEVPPRNRGNSHLAAGTSSVASFTLAQWIYGDIFCIKLKARPTGWHSYHCAALAPFAVISSQVKLHLVESQTLCTRVNSPPVGTTLVGLILCACLDVEARKSIKLRLR